MIKAIFFDFNGVIIDDQMIQMKSYQQVFRGHGIELTEEMYFAGLGMDDQTFMRTIFGKAGKPLTDELLGSVIQEKTAVHRETVKDELPFFPGVLTFVKATAREFQLGLVSMSNKTEVAYVFERAKLAPLFSVVVTAEYTTVCKPGPDCYVCGLTKLNEQRQRERMLPLVPAECLAIEDAPPGIESARAAGMRTLGVTNTVGEAALRAAGAEGVTQSLSDWTPDAVRLVYALH